MSMTMFAMRRVRVRIRSWKDVVLVVVVGAVVFGVQMILQKILGWEEKKARTVSVIVGVVLIVLWVFFVSGD